MSTIRYQCDTCKRKIDVLENQSGMTTFGKCIITSRCKGNLYKLMRNPENIREFLDEPSDPRIQNYFPRKLFFEHVQNIPKDAWEIRHNLGVEPAITVFDTSDSSSEPVIINQNNYTITIIDNNTIELKFNTNKQGIAHCIARSTTPLETPVVDAMGEEARRVTNSGIMNLGILQRIRTDDGQIFDSMDSNFELQFDVSVKEPNENETFCKEIVTHGGKGAWGDWNSILARKRRSYNIMHLDINSMVIIQDLYDSINDIPNGTQLKIISASYNGMSFEDIRSKNIIGLLSNAPHSNMDKVLNEIYDIGDISRSVINNTYEFINGELHILETQMEVIYPEIIQQN